MKMKKMIDESTWESVIPIARCIAGQIVSSHVLPGDYNVSFDEILSECYSECGYLINNYKAGEASLTTYIFQWLFKRAVKSLMKEYKIIKKNAMSIEQLEEEFNGDKDDPEAWIERHQIGKGEVPSLVVDEKEARETHDKTEHILSTFNFIDRKIAELHGRDGYSLPEVAKMIGLSRQAVAKRWDKICAKGWTFRDTEL